MMNVLAISNSFGADANRYLHQIARADGEVINVATLYIGGCPLEKHYRNMIGDARNYTLFYNGHNTGFMVSLEEALLNRHWDVVTLQQASHQSFKPECYEPYARELYDFVKTCQPKAKVLIHQTWAYEDGSEKLESMGFKTAKDMFARIENAYQLCHEALDTDGIIPCGKLMMELLDRGIEKVHRDTFHASLGLGRYALGLLWYRMLTGKSVAENTFRDFDEPVSDQQIAIAKAAVDAFDTL